MKKGGYNMRLAIDIDDTIYDTYNIKKRVNEKVSKLVQDKKFENKREEIIERIHLTKEIENDTNTYFNPEWRIEGAIAVLEKFIRENKDIELYIVTARYLEDKEWYSKLLKGTILDVPYNRIYQRYDAENKAVICKEVGIDIIVDDGTHNLIDHRKLLKRDKSYKTEFIWYKNPFLMQSGEYKYYNFRSSKEYRTTIMKDWNEFEEIIKVLKERSRLK